VANADPNPRLTPELEASLRQYVLGGLEEDARAGLEQQLVAEPDVFEALGVVEDELIEQYLDGTSTDLDRGAFEKHFLTLPARVARLKLARSLRARASRSMTSPTPIPVPRTTAWQPAFIGLAAALALSLVGNLWLVSRPPPQSESAGQVATVRPSPTTIAETPGFTPQPIPALATFPPTAGPGDDPAARIEREATARMQAETRIARLEEMLSRERSRSSVSFALASGALRAGGNIQRISVPVTAMLVRLRLEVSGDDYPSYRAVLVDGAGEEVWTASKLKAETESGQLAVVLALTPDRLPRGDYQVKLSGLAAGRDAEVVGSYPFRVGQP